MNDKEQLQRELLALENLINSKKSDVNVRRNELISTINPIRKIQLENSINNLNLEISSLERNYNILENRINNFENRNDNDFKEILENMSDDEAVKYFKDENSSSQKFLIIQNMTSNQIVSLIENVDNAKIFLNSVDNDKLLDVINNLSFDGIKKIFERTTNASLDTFESARHTLINKLKNKGLTEDAIKKIKSLGYDDFDEELAELQKNSNKNDNNSTTITKIIDINTALNEKNNIKKSYDDYLKSLGNLDLLSFNELNDIKLDDYLKNIDDLINSDIDKSDLNAYGNLFVSLAAIRKNIDNKKNEIQSKIKDRKDKIDNIVKDMQKTSNEIAKLNNEISKITDQNKKSEKENELSKLKEKLDDLLDEYGYLNQGNKYFQTPVFKNKNKPIKYGANAIKTTNDKSNQTKNNNTQKPIKKQSKPKSQTSNPQNQTQNTQQPSNIIIPNSIKDYIIRGELPNNLSESEYLDLSKLLSIPASDINYALTGSELKRLQTSKKVMMAIINQNTKIAHQGSINEYDEYDDLIKKYEDILSDMNSNKDREFIINIINDLKEKKEKYSDKVDNLGYDSAKNYINFENDKSKKQELENKRIDNISKQINQNDKVLNAKYMELKKLEEEKTKNPKFKDKIDKKIEIINHQIKELQSKQIDLNDKQTMIINKNTDKYIMKINEKQQRYRDEERRANAYAEKMLDIEYKKVQLEHEKEKLDNDINTMTVSNSADRKQKSKLKKDRAQINRQIEALKRKAGYASLENQVCKGVALAGYTK